MKKIVTTLALVLALGVVGSQLANAGWGRGAMMGSGQPAVAPAPQVDQAKQTFLDQTVELRKAMYEKRTAYFALMNTTPLTEEVKAEAKEVWQDIFDLQTQLRAMATELGLKDFGPGLGCDPSTGGGGANCANGPRNCANGGPGGPGGPGPRNCGNGPRNCGSGGCQNAPPAAPSN